MPKGKTDGEPNFVCMSCGMQSISRPDSADGWKAVQDWPNIDLLWYCGKEVCCEYYEDKYEEIKGRIEEVYGSDPSA